MSHLVALDLNPEIQKRDQVFQEMVAAVAGRHQLYLEEEQTTITACYTLELSKDTARIEIDGWLPIDLYEELHECFQESFR